jgi:hypothetical protein
MARANRKGRRSSGPPFTQLFNYMLEGAAWRSLKPQERAIYLEVARLYNGSNNGFLGLGVRAAAEGAKVNKDTAAKCLAVLVDRGFIEPTQAGRFNQNACRATEWRLTTQTCDRTGQMPSKAFLQWRPENSERRPKRGTAPSETKGQEDPNPALSVPRFRTIAGGLANG